MNIVKKTHLLFLFGFTAALFYPGPIEAARLRILTTTSDLRSLVESVGGERVQVDSLSRGTQDPHFIEAKPSYMVKARKAKLFIRIGMELEIGYESLILEGSRNPHIQTGETGHLDASQGIRALEIPTGKMDRSAGDIHPFGNPHYWLDPLNGVIMARNIAERLSALAPDPTREFEKNYRLFEEKIYRSLYGEELVTRIGGKRLARMDREGTLWDFLKKEALKKKLGGWRGALAPFRGTGLITYHRSWPYFLHRFELVEVETLEPKPGISPSPGHILKVIKQMKTEQISVILMEMFYDEKPARLVAGKAGGRVVKVANSVGGSEEARDYFSMIDAIVRHLAEALQDH